MPRPPRCSAGANATRWPKQDGVWALGRGMSMASTFCARFPAEARVRVTSDGHVFVEGSSNDIGTGNQTVFALLAAETLGTDPDNVTIRWGDTRLPPAGRSMAVRTRWARAVRYRWPRPSCAKSSVPMVPPPKVRSTLPA